MKRILLGAIFALTLNQATAAANANGLYETARRLDAVVFDAGYNDCDIETLGTVIAEDLEFYHDQGGPMYCRQAFLDSMRNGICKLDYKARRELVDGSMQVFPLHDDGELYGMIHSGAHRFHAKYPNRPEHPTGRAKFTMLWLLGENDDWKLSRVLSFDHVGLDGTNSEHAPADSGMLYDELAERDAALFDAAFVACDESTFQGLFTKDAEFYHDQSGATFGEQVRALNGCPADNGIRRIRVPASLRVYPINNYGAIQTGEHWFVEEGASTSTRAQFIHVWKRDGDSWRLARVLSFDHQSRPRAEGPQ